MKGIEYSTYTSSSFSYAVEGVWGFWQPVPSGKTKFSARTRFRMAPVYAYEVRTDKSVVYKNRTDAMSEVAAYLNIGMQATIRKFESPEDQVANPLLQYQFGDGNWQQAQIGSTPVSFTNAPEFRIRPDYYHRVTTLASASVANAVVDFHDVDALAKYVDNRIRTDGPGFTLAKVAYLDEQ